MKKEEQIREKLEWLINATYDKDNDSELAQAKLYAQIDLIKWLGVTR